MKEIVVPSENIPIIDESDICVIGGGCTGVFAAIRAARLGGKFMSKIKGSEKIIPHGLNPCKLLQLTVIMTRLQGNVFP